MLSISQSPALSWREAAEFPPCSEADFVASGPSGCGKSTLLRLIAGLDQPDDGRLAWDGGPPAPGDIGFVFQDATLLPWATAEDNVFLPLRLRGMARDAAMPEVHAILHHVGLDGIRESATRAHCPAACACACRSPGPW